MTKPLLPKITGQAKRPTRSVSFSLFSLLVFLTLALVSTPFALQQAITPAVAAVGINRQLSFQGRVVNSNGTNVSNGTYSFDFAIYDVSTGGTPIWTETKSLTVTNGVFATNLGSSTALPGSLDFNTDTLYLGIDFNGDGEMEPRIRLTAVAQAFNAERVNGLTVTASTGTLTIPNATTISFGGQFTTVNTNPISLAAAGGGSTLTLPASGTLATLAGTETFTNKTIGDNLTFSGASTPTINASGGSATLQINTTNNRPVTFGSGLVTTGGSVSVGADLSATGTLAITSSSTLTGVVGIGTSNSASTALNIVGGTTGASSLRIATGVAPSSPVTGDIWNTGTRLNFRTSALANESIAYQSDITAAVSGTSNYIAKFTSSNVVGNSQVFDNGTGVSIGGSSPASLFNVGNSNQFQVNSSGAIAALTGITTSGGYTQSGTTANTFSGATTFSASGTAITVTNNVLVSGSITSPTLNVGTAGASTGALNLSGATSGTITIQTQAAAGTYNFNLPTTAGTSGYFLTSGGGGSTAMTWTDPGSLSVGTATNLAGGSAGQIPYQSAPSTTTFVGGSSGQILSSGGTGAPSFINIASALTAGTNINITGTTNATVNVVNNPTFSGLVTGSAGLTVTGAAVNLNANSNFAVNIGTGTSNAGVTIGGSSNTVAITSTGLNVSTAGAVSGVTTINASGAITGGSITDGTATLASGSLSNAVNGTFSGTVQAGTLNATSAIQLNGVSINTAGTLTNVAYENQANTFTLANLFSASGTALTVTNNASIGGQLSLGGQTLFRSGGTAANPVERLFYGRSTLGVQSFDESLYNFGNIWVPKDSNRDWSDVAISSDGSRQTAVVYGGQIYVSTNYGNTWTAKDSSRNWNTIAISSDGSRQTAVVYGGQIYVSTDYGNTWTAKDSSRNWHTTAMSADGSHQSAAVYGGQIYVSTDYGETWTAKDSSRNWRIMAMSADGSRQSAAVYGGQIYVSTDYGETWTAKDSNRNWYGIAMSADGSRQTAVVYGGQIYVSTDYGETWTAKDSSRDWHKVAMSADGSRQVAIVGSGQIYVSTDYGETWTAKDSSRAWQYVAMSASGSYMAATVWGGQIYTSVTEKTTQLANLTINPGSAYTGNLLTVQTGGTTRFTIAQSGAATISAGGLTVSAGGASITGATTVAGGAINLNNNSNFAVNIGTGTSTGAVSIGGGSNTFSLNSTALDISTAGALTGVTGITTSGGYTQSGTTANTFSGATTFSASGTALSVTNSASVGGTLTVPTITTASGAAFNAGSSASGGISGGVTIASATANLAGSGLSGAVVVQSGDSGSTDGQTGTVILRSGNGGTSGGSSGSILIDAGTGTTRGTISIGATNAGAITIGRSGQAATIGGTLSVTSTLTASNGFTVASGNSTFTPLAGTGNRLAVLDSSGVLGRGTIDPANVLTVSGGGTGLADPGSNGVVVRTASGVTTTRTITGTANQVTVTNGDGVSANPTLSLPQDIATTSGVQFGTLNLGTASNNGTLTVRRGTSGTALAVRNTGDSATVFSVADTGATTINGGLTVFTGGATVEGGFSVSISSLDKLVVDGTGVEVTDNLNVVDGVIQTAGTTRLTNAGALQNISTIDASGLITGTAGLTITGAVVNLNANSNFAVNIGTGTSTGAVSIGGGSNTFSLNSTALDISTAGALTGVTGITTSGGYTQSGTTANTFSGATTFSASGTALSVTNSASVGGLITGTGGLAITGAAVNLNASSNFATNINTGTSTGNVTIGNSLNNFIVSSANLSVTSGGILAIGGTTGVTTLAAGMDNLQISALTNISLMNSTSVGGELLVADNVTSGENGGITGSFRLAGGTSGIVTIQPQAAAGTYNFNLPTTAGTSGFVLTSAGGGSSAMTWTDPSALAVRWNSITNPTGNQSLSMGTNTTAWNYATGTGSNNLFSLTTDASANGTGALLNIQTGSGASVQPVRVRAGAVEALTVSSAGAVGIGTNGPADKVSIVATASGTGTNEAAISLDRWSSSDAARFFFKTTGTYNWAMGLFGGSNNYNFRDESVGANRFILEQGFNGTQLFLESTGDVGIGTVAPTTKLSVSSNGTDLLNFATSGTLATLSTSAGLGISIKPATGILSVDTAGVQNRLRVYGSGGTVYGEFTNNNTNTILSSSSGELQLSGAGGNQFILGSSGNPMNLVFEESSTISGQGANTITLGQSGDTFNFNVSGVTYNAANLQATGLTLNTTATGSTALLVNGPTGQTANLLDLQVNSSSRLSVSAGGALNTVSSITSTLTGGVAVAATGAPAASGTSSLVRLGALLSGGSSDGTYIGINAAGGYVGNFVDFQVNNASSFKIASSGGVTVALNSASATALSITAAGSQTADLITVGKAFILDAVGKLASAETLPGAPLVGVDPNSGSTRGDLVSGSGPMYPENPSEGLSLNIAPGAAFTADHATSGSRTITRRCVLTTTTSISLTDNSTEFIYLLANGSNTTSGVQCTVNKSTTLPTYNARYPVAVIAKTVTSGGATDSVTDTRSFIGSTLIFATATQSLQPGQIVIQNTSANNEVDRTTSAAATGVVGIVAVGNDAAGQVMIATSGSVWAQAVSGAARGVCAGTSTTSGLVNNITAAVTACAGRVVTSASAARPAVLVQLAPN